MIKVCINPGHCPGFDSGAVGFGITEAEKVLSIGKKVEKILQAAGIKTKLVQLDGLAEISNASKLWGANYFVSIHCNAANTSARGTETYYYRNAPEEKPFAESVHAEIRRAIPELIDRGVKSAGFSVIARSHCPAVLVETAFIDNAADNQLLKNREDEFATAIAKGILNFIGVKFPVPDVIDEPADNIPIETLANLSIKCCGLTIEKAKQLKPIYYHAAVKSLRLTYFNAEKHSTAMKAVIFARAVQNGVTGCVNIFKSACQNLGYENLSYVDDKWFDKDFIAAIYNFLSSECNNAKPIHDFFKSPNGFCRGTREHIDALNQQFKNESLEALKMLRWYP